MKKEETLMLKGIAILLMLFLHLFNNIEEARACHNLLLIGDVPFAHILTRAANPVAFYIILSGYGLYVVQHVREYDVIGKLKKLYVHYWVSLFLLIPVGTLMFGTDKYPHSLADILSNMTGYHTTWNATIWFLLPYVLLALASKRIWMILDAVKPWLYLSFVFCISVICSCLISRYGTSFLYANCWAYIPVLFFQMLFPLSLGAYLAKYRRIVKWKAVRGGVILSCSPFWSYCAVACNQGYCTHSMSCSLSSCSSIHHCLVACNVC